jgi:hypothetical protein
VAGKGKASILSVTKHSHRQGLLGKTWPHRPCFLLSHFLHVQRMVPSGLHLSSTTCQPSASSQSQTGEPKIPHSCTPLAAWEHSCQLTSDFLLFCKPKRLDCMVISEGQRPGLTVASHLDVLDLNQFRAHIDAHCTVKIQHISLYKLNNDRNLKHFYDLI